VRWYHAQCKGVLGRSHTSSHTCRNDAHMDSPPVLADIRQAPRAARLLAQLAQAAFGNTEAAACCALGNAPLQAWRALAQRRPTPQHACDRQHSAWCQQLLQLHTP
jgi:hypothetical protein